MGWFVLSLDGREYQYFMLLVKKTSLLICIVLEIIDSHKLNLQFQYEIGNTILSLVTIIYHDWNACVLCFLRRRKPRNSSKGETTIESSLPMLGPKESRFTC